MKLPATRIYLATTSVLCLIAFIILTLYLQPKHTSLHTLSGTAMGTTYTIKITNHNDHPINKSNLKTQITTALNKIEDLMSIYRPNSEISKFNKSTDTQTWFQISKETTQVIQEALRISKLSNGAFDSTVGPLVNLWSFGPDKRSYTTIPSQEQIQQALAKVGYTNIELQTTTPQSIRKKIPDLYIDLSSIAKGYGVDTIATLLEQYNITNYMVEVGGEIRTRGLNQNNLPWKIGIETPTTTSSHPQLSTQTIISSTYPLSIATSGDYRSYFELNNTRYSHIIDPTSGKPITHKLASVTVLAPSCMTADALATALFVMGPHKGYEFALKHKIAAFFITKTHTNFTQKSTPQFTEKLSK